MKVKNPRERLRAVLLISQNIKQCGHGDELDDKGMIVDGSQPVIGRQSGCGNMLPKFRRDRGVKIICEFPENVELDSTVDRKREISAQKVYFLFVLFFISFLSFLFFIFFLFLFL